MHCALLKLLRMMSLETDNCTEERAGLWDTQQLACHLREQLSEPSHGTQLGRASLAWPRRTRHSLPHPAG